MAALTPYEQARLYTFAHLVVRLYQACQLLNAGQEVDVHTRSPDGLTQLLFSITEETVAIWERVALRLFTDELAGNAATALPARDLVSRLHQLFPHVQQGE